MFEADMNDSVIKHVDISLASNVSWRSFGKVVSFFRRWQSYHKEIQRQHNTCRRGERVAKYQGILKGISLRQIARGYFRTWRIQNRIRRRNRKSVFNCWRTTTAVRKRDSESGIAVRDGHMTRCRAIRALRRHAEARALARRQRIEADVCSSRAFWSHHTSLLSTDSRSCSANMWSLSDLKAFIRGDCILAYSMCIALRIFAGYAVNRKRLRHRLMIGTEQFSRRKLSGAMQHWMSRKKYLKRKRAQMRSRVLHIKTASRHTAPQVTSGLFVNELMLVDSLLSRENRKQKLSRSKYSLYMGCSIGGTYMMQTWAVVGLRLLRALRLWRLRMMMKITLRIQSRVGSTLWIDMKWRQWKRALMRDKRSRKARNKALEDKAVGYWRRLYGRIVLVIWRQRARALSEQYRIAYVFRIRGPFDFLMRKARLQRTLRQRLIGYELRRDLELTNSSFRHWHRQASKRKRLRIFVAVREKREAYANMSLLELSPFICTAGDIKIDCDFHHKRSLMLIKSVWCGWKELSQSRGTLIRKSQSMAILKYTFCAWVTTYSRSVASRYAVEEEGENREIGIPTTLLELAYGETSDEERHSSLATSTYASDTNVPSARTLDSIGKDNPAHVLVTAGGDGEYYELSPVVAQRHLEDDTCPIADTKCSVSFLDECAPNSDISECLDINSTPIQDAIITTSQGNMGARRYDCSIESLIKPLDMEHDVDYENVTKLEIGMSYSSSWHDGEPGCMGVEELADELTPGKDDSTSISSSVVHIPPITCSFEALLQEVLDDGVRRTARESHFTPSTTFFVSAATKVSGEHALRNSSHACRLSIVPREDIKNAQTTCKYTVDDRPLRRGYCDVHLQGDRNLDYS